MSRVKKTKYNKKAIFAVSAIAGIGAAGIATSAMADISLPLPVDAPDLESLTVVANANSTVYARNAQMSLTTTSNKNIVVPGSTVTYTYKVVNTGTVDFKNLVIEDDKCSPTAYVSGNNSDPLLNVGETWTYTCSTKVLKDQTNNAKVTGTPVIPSSTATPTPTPTGTVTPTPTPTPSPTATGGTVKDGTYLGKQATVVVAGEGISYPIQVQATVSGGKLTAVTVPVFGATDTTSKNIGKYNVATLAAMNSDPANPTMIFEALQAQSANIAVISGATYTTAGFKTSLADALVQAGF
jgi:uncharacterized repeat protein (TIGR01451 family)